MVYCHPGCAWWAVVPPSLDHSLPPSLTHSLARSLCHPLTHIIFGFWSHAWLAVSRGWSHTCLHVLPKRLKSATWPLWDLLYFSLCAAVNGSPLSRRHNPLIIFQSTHKIHHTRNKHTNMTSTLRKTTNQNKRSHFLFFFLATDDVTKLLALGIWRLLWFLRLRNGRLSSLHVLFGDRLRWKTISRTAQTAE